MHCTKSSTTDQKIQWKYILCIHYKNTQLIFLAQFGKIIIWTGFTVKKTLFTLKYFRNEHHF